MMSVCTEDTSAGFYFSDYTQCSDECEAVPVSSLTYTADAVASAAISDGNHVQCRIFHVASGAMFDTEEHCEHAKGVTLCEAPTP
jgi:hypothetical protein